MASRVLEQLSGGANETLVVTILATGLLAALMHALLPTHWLPFVLVGRGQGWSIGRTIRAAALAGTAHVVFTVALGIGVVLAGLELKERYEGVLTWTSGGVLIALGLWYLIAPGEKPPKNGKAPHGARRRYASDGAALFSLVAALAIHPSEAFLPVYLTAADLGWPFFAVLSVLLLVFTLVGMTFFVWIAAITANKLRLERLERYERFVLAVALCGLGAFVLSTPH